MPLDSADFDLTPLGERRPRLPLQRKVKQLQRPWQSAKSTDEDAVHRHIWEASRDKNSDARRRGGRQQQRRSHSGVPAATPARPSTSRSGYSKRRLLFRSVSSGSLMAQRNRRRRPSTGSSWSPSQERVTQSPSTWTTTSCLSLSGRGIGASSSSDFKVVCWDGTTLAPTGAAALFAAKSSLDRSSLPSEQPDSAVGAATVATEATGRDSVALRTGDATPHCSFRANPFDPDKADIVAEAPLNNNTPTSPVIRQQKDKKAAVKSGRVDISGETVDLLPPADSSSGAPATRLGRPASAGSSSGHRSRHGNFYHMCMSRENQIDRPQSARASSSTWSTCFSVEEYSPAVGDEGQEVESTGGRISVAVTLPLLIEVDDTDEARFMPGSCSRSPTRTNLQVEDEAAASYPTRLAEDLAEEVNIISAEGQGKEVSITESGRAKQILLPAPTSKLGALDHFVEEDPGSHSRHHPSLSGKALTGSRSRSAPCHGRRTSPLLPGEPRHGTAHPLSPTNMGSPPRQHRNSNWGEEGMRLAQEEKENSRFTVPFVVSSTMLGWKLSTRGRKKTFEAAFQSSEYSDHHLIPVYGFRYERGNGGGSVAQEKRGEQRRIEARALAAESVAVERRARAEDVAQGAAFARAMSRRALARASWIRKMGDVANHREEKVRRCSSPGNVDAYRERVRDRVQAERFRKRAAKGLPSHRPPRIAAITSRVDLTRETKGKDTTAAAAAAAAATAGGPSAGGTEGMDEEVLKQLQVEPYLMLLQARNQQQKQANRRNSSGNAGGDGKQGVILFCSQCLGGTCKGPCSPVRSSVSDGEGATTGKKQIAPIFL